MDVVKISFFLYDYEQIFPFINYEGVNIADVKVVDDMKIDVISARGRKKDFFDLYFRVHQVKDHS